MSDQRETGIIVGRPNRKCDPDHLKTFNIVGKKGVRRKDGYEKASGKALFSSDFTFPGTLYARILSNPHAHAKIKSMDISEAEAYPGVRYILKYDDPDIFAQIMVVPSEGLFEGEPIGVAVVADTDEIAQEALRLIKVEWDVLPFVLHCDDALKPGALLNMSPRGWEGVWDPSSNYIGGPTAVSVGPVGQKMGDIEQGFLEADQIIEFTYNRPENTGRSEPCTCSVWWKDDHYEYAFNAQFDATCQNIMQFPANYPQAAGHAHACYNGGSFGVGSTVSLWSFFAAAVISQRLMRPVKVMYDMQQSYYGSVSNDCGQDHYKVGFKNDGTITAVQCDAKYHGGTYETGLTHIAENTSIRNLLCNYTGAFTNRPRYQAYRSEQRCACVGITLVTEHVAAALGMDPTLVALKNDGAHGKDMNYLKQFKKDNGFPDRDSLKECIDAAKNAIDFDNKWHPAGTKTLVDGRKHGIGFSWDHEWSDMGYRGSGAVMLREDGTAEIISAHDDVGVNAETTYCQIVAEELGLKIEDVYMKHDIEGHGFVMQSTGSANNTAINGWVVKVAAQKVRAQMIETAIKGVVVDMYPTYEDPIAPPTPTPFFPGLEPEDIDIKDSVMFEKKNPDNKHTVLELVNQTRSDKFGGISYQGSLLGYHYYHSGLFGADTPHRERMCRQAHFCEVAVDTETGEIEILKVVNVNDVGKAISPEGVNAQQYGGTVMGIGRGLIEEGIYDPSTGIRLNGNILDYKVPTMRDCGPIDTIIVETALGYGPYGLVGVGEETSDMMGTTIGPAVYNAIGVWIDDYPITPDKVLKALGKA